MHSAPIERGHFVLKSGLHTDVWMEQDGLFLDLASLAPQFDALAGELRPYAVTAVCGPLIGGALVAQAMATRLGVHYYFTERELKNQASTELFSATYRLPASVRSHASTERFAVVDDAISAGSATRATVSTN